MTSTETRIDISHNEELLKLEEIFLPKFYNKKRQYYLSDTGLIKNDALFVHYTSVKAALSIIREKRIWMRNAMHMSDYLEVQHGFDIMARLVSNENDRWIKFRNVIEEAFPEIVERAIKIYNDNFHGINHGTYVLSVSEHDMKENKYGRLSMWRAFGGQSERVAIVFKIPALSAGSQALQIFFNPVSYTDKDEEYVEIEEVIENIKNNRSFLERVNPDIIAAQVFSMILVNVVCMKHEGFREEREWRSVYFPKCFASEVSSRLIESNVEDVAGVPQVVYKIPLDSAFDSVLADLDFFKLFDGLIIGPSKYPYAMYEAFCQELEKIGVVDAALKVRSSDIPIR